MKRFLSALCFLILATGCERISPQLGPSRVPAGVLSTAVLSGTISQSSLDGAAPVADALVELLQQDVLVVARAHADASDGRDVSVVSCTTTDSDGHYQFVAIALGTYALRITKTGFTTYESGDFQLSGNLEFSADLQVDGITSDPSQPRRIRR